MHGEPVMPQVGKRVDFNIVSYDQLRMRAEAAEAKVAELEAEIQGFREYKPDEIELENWSFQHFDFLDPEEKEALKILSNRARLATELEAKVAEQAATIERLTAESKHFQQKLALIIDQSHYADSYGVEGSSFSVCRWCGGGSGPGGHYPFKHNEGCLMDDDELAKQVAWLWEEPEATQDESQPASRTEESI